MIDTEALIDGLKRRRIGAACLDVYEEESDLFYEDRSDSIVEDDVLVRLIAMPNVIVTSHQAVLTREALNNIAAATVENLLKFKLPKVFTAQTTPSHKSRLSVKGKLRLNDENGIDADYSLQFSGITKEATVGLTDVMDWARDIEDYLGIPEGKRFKSDSYDAVERKKEIEEAVRKLSDSYLYGADDYNIDSFDIAAHGVRPDAPDFKMTLVGRMPETVGNVGNDLIVSIGRFHGKAQPLTGTDRNRQTDISVFGPVQSQYDYEISIPEGYEADPASLAALKTMVNNPLGMFYAEAVDNGDGTLSLRTRTKMNVATAPIGAWDDFLKIDDAITAFYDSVLVLKKK